MSVDLLIDRHHVIVFKNDLDRNVFGCNIGGFRRRDANGHFVAQCGLIAVLGFAAIDGDLALLDKFLDERSRQTREATLQILVEATPRTFLANHQRLDFETALFIANRSNSSCVIFRPAVGRRGIYV